VSDASDACVFKVEAFRPEDGSSILLRIVSIYRALFIWPISLVSCCGLAYRLAFGCSVSRQHPICRKAFRVSGNS